MRPDAGSGASSETIRSDTRPATNICVIFATRGRPAVVTEVVNTLQRQTLSPTSIILSCVSVEDAGALADRPAITVLIGKPGLAAQRNTALRHLGEEVDLVVFFDDDFVPHPDWIDAIEKTFRIHRDVGVVTGHVIADGIKGPGLSMAAAEQAIAQFPRHDLHWIRDPYSPYGCNMAFRRSAVSGLDFDERLVLYGWLEDRDFGAALTRRGWRSIMVGDALGVHLGVKKGRVSGRRLGYSQVINPIYLHRKGSMSLRLVAHHIFGNLASNLVRSFAPEPYIDRFGRLCGNVLGMVDFLMGRMTPEKAERL